MNERLSTFLAPVLLGVVLLYQALAELQLALIHDATLLVVGTVLAAALAAGLAALGPALVRMTVLTLTALVTIDVVADLPDLFTRLTPRHRLMLARDRQRVSDLHTLKAAVERYVSERGVPPAPQTYGEGSGVAEFWEGWWDVSGRDEDGDGEPFMEFLVEAGIVPSVPVDPLNQPGRDDDPRGGRQYAYLLVPPDYEYEGGTCGSPAGAWVYLLAVTDLEYERERPPAEFTGSGCACLWQTNPNYFQHHFDYVLCGTVDSAR